MRKNYKKLVLVACIVACICGICTGCTTDTENKQNTEQQSTNEEHGGESSEVIEKEVEIESDSGEKIEYSLEGPAGEDDTQSDNDKQEKNKE